MSSFYCVVCLFIFLLNLVTGIGTVLLSCFFSNRGGGVSLILAILPYPCCISILASLPPVSAVTPLQARQFSWELQFHPNRQKVDFVLDGIHHGFKLGFCHTQRLKPAKKNKPSADQHASVIDEYLAHEMSRGRVAGPFDFLPLPNLQVSSFSVIPKWGQVGKWRLIVEMRRPGYCACHHGNQIKFGQPSCPPASSEAISLAGPDKLVAIT